MNFPWHQYVMALLYIVAGANHFRTPKIYQRIMPPYIPAKSSMVYISGVIEMILGFMLLNKDTQTIAAWGIIILLIIFIPVHIYMLTNERAALKMPKWALILRLPLQFVLMYWAYLYI
ncbi:MauE/DoxX family redox-associated membrane protein [Jejudonia soesokkakensis]|uniref:MauE/DoxX family redox-associated membrane protein n=1 Tax=Jejudonia soesokkakensis TaxID=1323432 RepID=A0ABW2MPY9_9FLAO